MYEIFFTSEKHHTQTTTKGLLDTLTSVKSVFDVFLNIKKRSSHTHLIAYILFFYCIVQPRLPYFFANFFNLIQGSNLFLTGSKIFCCDFNCC